jgi:hypothetical protein
VKGESRVSFHQVELETGQGKEMVQVEVEVPKVLRLPQQREWVPQQMGGLVLVMGKMVVLVG